MKNLTIIAAVGKNLELGKNNSLIWHLKKDLDFFKKNTIGKPIVMGLNTFKSLPGLLPNRHHIILTHQAIEESDQITVFHSKRELLDFIQVYQKEVMVIGGASIYLQMLPHAQKLILTEIDQEENQSDTFFPSFNKTEWNFQLISIQEENNIKYKHIVYTKKLGE